MNRTFLSATLALALAGSVALAQQPAAPYDAAPSPAAPLHLHHTPNAQRETKRLSKQLGLTHEQTARLEPILVDRNHKIADLRSDNTLSRKEMREQARSIHEGTMQQLQSVLTPEQMQQMKAMHHHHGGKPQADPAQPAPGV